MKIKQPAEMLQRDYGLQLAEQLGTQASTGALGQVMGMLFQGANNKNQQNQNEALLQQQVQAQKQLGDYNYTNQLKMWNATNTEAQMQHIKDAGLNPALMYGGGGAGGQTVAGGQAGSVNGSTAAPAPNAGMALMNTQQMQQTQSQIELTEAQKANIEADTANKQAENPNIAKTGSQIEATTGNIKADTALKEINAQLAKIQTDWQGEINEATVSKINQEWVQIANTNEITQATKDAQKQQIITNAANAVIQGQSMKMGIQVDKAQINKMSEDIAQGWEQLGQTEQERQAHITQMISQAGLMDKEKSLLLAQTILQGVGAVANAIGKVKGNTTTVNPKTTIHNYNAENSY